MFQLVGRATRWPIFTITEVEVEAEGRMEGEDKLDSEIEGEFKRSNTVAVVMATVEAGST